MAADFFGARSVEEDVKSFVVLAQKKWRAAADNHCIPFPGNSGGNLLHPFHHAVGIKSLIGEVSAAFVAAAPESFRQAVEAAIHALVAALNGGLVNVGEAGDLFGEALVPESPAEMFGELGGDGAAAATVLPFDGDHAKHG